MINAKILVIDDEPDMGWLFAKILSEEDCEVLVSLNGPDGISKIKLEKPDLVFLDLKLPGMDGIQVLKEIRRFDKDLLVIIMTAYETVKTAIDAMKLGAYDYLSKPVNIEKIKTVVRNALKTQVFIKNADFRQEIRRKIDFDCIVGESLQVKKVLELVEKAAPHDITVLLLGASGTGKELIAQAIHRTSSRADKPFVVIDCAILPDTLVESEIFGHERGAFTGANERKLGKFEFAQGGTVFLDEIGNLSHQTQVKLLRAIQEREIERLGGKNPIKVDVRLIAATNANLEKAISTGRFREDLYYRLNVFSIQLPPLKDRSNDVKLLADYFLEKFSTLFKKKIKHISPPALELLNKYSWPGNVRELRNVIESAVLLAKDSILPKHLPLKIQDVQEERLDLDGSLKTIGKKAKKKAEKEMILRVLEEVNWNKSMASRMLKVDYKTLFNKIKEYNITRN